MNVKEGTRGLQMADSILAAETSARIMADRPPSAVTSSPHHPVAPSRLFWPRLLPALATGGLLWLGHFPVAWGWLAWVALVPLLCLVRRAASARCVFLCAWVGGLVFFVPALQWMRVAHPAMYATWLALAIYCSLFVPVGICLVRWLDRRTSLPLVVTLPVVWTALEFFRAHFGGGFPWYFLSHTQHALLPVIQVSDLAGAYAVTFLIAAVNALAFELLYTRRGFRCFFALSDEAPRRYSLVWQVVVVLLVVGAVLGYGAWRLSQNAFDTGPRIALIQGNLEQAVRNERDNPDGGEAAKKSMVHHYRDLSDQAISKHPDLIVWPETSYPEDWVVTPDGQPNKESLKLARIVAERWRTPVLLGLNVQALQNDDRSRRYNSAILIQADGGAGGRYDKIHRVPFGEYVPFGEALPFMNHFSPYDDSSYSVHAGEHFTRFPLGVYHFGVIICYEDSDPYLARQYVRADSDGPAVDFLLNISNDGWFDGTSEHEEHLAICRFRAVECRRAVARAVNMGISAVIDGNGRVVALPADSWSQSKKIEAVLTANIPIDRRASLYALWGDWLPWGCWLVVSLGVGWGIVRRKQLQIVHCPLPIAN